MTPARKHIPNLLTILRLVLAAIFFVMLAVYQTGDAVLLLASAVVFIVAAVTDALDGHLARKWQVVSKFGRVVDPFADKVLVLGGFILLAGANLAAESGVAAWMAVVILGRELLITTLRGAFESEGVDFSANLWGKLKMILQAIVIPIVLVIIALTTGRDFITDASYVPASWHRGLFWTRDILVWATVAVTVLSGIPYIAIAVRASKPVSSE